MLFQIIEQTKKIRKGAERSAQRMANFSQNDLTDSEKSNLRGLRKRKIDLIDEIEAIKNELKAVDAELETLYYVDEGSKSRNRLLIQGKKKFNADPSKGIDWLCERALLEQTPTSIAQWLFKGEGLSKNAIGDYLGLNEPQILEILDEFVRLHDFGGMHMVDALRLFLWSFRLPGESQKIDRIMEKFAAHYCTANPGIFKCADDCFLLSFSCIMLNTLLHNPNIKERPTFDRYVSINKEMLENNNISQQMLHNIYDSIKQQAFKLPQDNSGISELLLNPECEGWLYKQSSNQFISGPLSWKRRWFVLADACLYYFEQTTDKEPRGIIPLQNVGIRKVEVPSRPHMFEVYSLSDERIKACKTEQDGRMVEGRHSVYRICANSSDEMKRWIDAIGNAIQTFPARPRSTH